MIREKVAIDPKPAAVSIPTTAPAGPALSLLEFGTTGYYDFVRTTVPGVLINGVLTVTPTEIPPQSALEISVGGSKIYKKVNGCGGTASEVVNPFPIQFLSCGTVGMAGNSWSPYYWFCLSQRSASQARAEITGPTSAKLTVEGDIYAGGPPVHWKAVLELTASVDPLYQPSKVKVTPVDSELVNAGSTTVNVEVRNGAGALMTSCNGASPLMVTANLEAKGPYAYLQKGTQSGSSVTFPLSGGKGSVSLVLDPANGVIPECSETVTLTVAVGDVSGSSTMNLKCGLDHFTVTTNPDTVEIGKSTKIYVQAKDKENNNIDIDANTGLHVVLAQGELYGNLITPNGFMGKTIEALYGDIRNGKVSFVANGDSPGLTPKSVQIGVSKIGEEGKQGVGIVVVTGQPELVILSPQGSSEEKRITDKPEMPELEAQAQLKNYSGGTVTFYWYFVLRWKSPEPRQFDDIFQGQTTAQNSNLTTWKVPWNNKIRGGDDMILHVTALVGDMTFDAEVTNPYKIGGDNPSIQAVKDGLAAEEQVIVYMESSPKWRHFKSDGFPAFGPPRGYGLMQIDNPRATDEEVWNWTANKEAGKRVLNQKNTDATGFPGRIRKRISLPIDHDDYLEPGYKGTPDFNTTELLLKESFQRYNGGNYWFWKPKDIDDPEKGGEWVVAAKPKSWETSPYGTRAWSIYQQVVSANNGKGSYPEAWN